jgi:hypothetical protein
MAETYPAIAEHGLTGHEQTCALINAAVDLDAQLNRRSARVSNRA